MAVRAGGGKMRPQDEKRYMSQLTKAANRGKGSGKKITTLEGWAAAGMKVNVHENTAETGGSI